MQWHNQSPSCLHRFIPEPEVTITGKDLPRKAWVKLNRLRTGVGRFGSTLHRWGMRDTASFECGADAQTPDHLIMDCSQYRSPNGIDVLIQLDRQTRDWLMNSNFTI